MAPVPAVPDAMVRGPVSLRQLRLGGLGLSPDLTFIEWWFGKVRRFNWSWPLRGTILNPLPTAQDHPLPGSPFTFEADSIDPTDYSSLDRQAKSRMDDAQRKAFGKKVVGE